MKRINVSPAKATVRRAMKLDSVPNVLASKSLSMELALKLVLMDGTKEKIIVKDVTHYVKHALGLVI